MEALGEDAVGDVIIDCSCGSGLFTREFAEERQVRRHRRFGF